MRFESQKIAIIVSDLHYFNSGVLMGLYHQFIEHHFDIQIFVTNENPDKEKDIISDLLDKNDPLLVGLIIFTCMNDPSFYVNKIQKIKLPYVFVDRLLPYINQCNFVTVDNYGTAKKIAKLLFDKGLKHVVCFSMLHENKLSTIEDRINGLKDGYQNKENTVCTCVELDYYNLYESLNNEVSQWIKNKYFPDAIFATNHLIVNAWISLLHQYKNNNEALKKIIVSCIDNLPYYDWIKIPIISAEQPINEISSYAAQILLKKITDKEKQQFSNIILPLKIIDRCKINH